MKKIKWTGLVCLATMLFLGTVSITVRAEGPAGMEEVAKNESLTLYLNEEDTSLVVMDNATGKMWYTNPVDTDNDAVANAYYKEVMKSQLQIQYYNTKAQSFSMNNYTDSIQNGQFEIEYLEDGVRITYTLGQMEETLLLPEAISEERFLSFTGKMDEADAKKIGRYYKLVDVAGGLTTAEKQYLETYPGFDDENFYILRNNVGAYMQEQLAEYLAGAGYSSEDYKADKAQSGVEEEEGAWFVIPITYRLEGENLLVSVEPEKVDYNKDGYYLVDMDILPYFGAVSEAEGYLFVPDGSGALIYLNNGKNASNYSSYVGTVYGQDESTRYLSTTKSEVDASYTVKLPVFGIKADDQALFAIIEEGAGYADISADIAGKTSSYNNIYAGFAYLQYGAASLTERLSDTSSYNLYSSGNLTGNYQLRYAFLIGEDADYSGMASYYREYLEDQGTLTRDTGKKEVPLYTEYIGAIDKYKTFLGFRYSATESLTTYAQAEEIASQLTDLGVENQVMIYSGWMNGGLHGKSATKAKPVGELEKGGVTVEKLQSDMKEKGIDTFMTVEMQYVYQDTLFDDYSSQQYGPGYFDRSDITVKEYSLSDGYISDTLANLISPYYAGKVTDSITKAASKYELNGLNLGTASWFLYSDFLEKRYTDRQAAIGLYRESFAALEESVDKLLGENGNVYSFPYVDYMINAPLYSNGYQILDEDIPFYEMVIHGYMSYSGEAINLADDYQSVLLKSVESGAGLHYIWIYEDNSLLKETDYDYLYSVHYGDWIDTASKDYKRVSEVLEGLGNQRIIRHEIVDENVRKTTYEDGTEIYVNYGSEAVKCGDVTVDAMDFAVRKGGN